jgi:hypothetical protein
LGLKKTPGGKKIQGRGAKMVSRNTEISEENVMGRTGGEIKVKGEKIASEIF